MDVDQLQFNTEFWEKHLPDIQNTTTTPELRVHLVISLIIHLALPFRAVLLFMFTSNISAVKEKASRFMAFSETAKDEAIRFPPAALFNLWHTRWPKSRPKLHTLIVKPCGDEIALQESDCIIEDMSFQINLGTLTIRGIRELLQPKILVEKFRRAAPFMFGWMYIFAASPNRYRRDKETARRRRAGPEAQADEEVDGKDLDDDPDDEDSGDRGDFDRGSQGENWWKDHSGFSRNPIFVSLLPHIFRR